MLTQEPGPDNFHLMLHMKTTIDIYFIVCLFVCLDHMWLLPDTLPDPQVVWKALNLHTERWAPSVLYSAPSRPAGLRTAYSADSSGWAVAGSTTWQKLTISQVLHHWAMACLLYCLPCISNDKDKSYLLIAGRRTGCLMLLILIFFFILWCHKKSY